MFTARAMFRAGGLDCFTAGPVDTLLLVLAVLALPLYFGFFSFEVVWVLVAELMRKFMAVFQEYRAQRGQIPLRIVERLAAGLIRLAQPATPGLDWFERQEWVFVDDDAVVQRVVGVDVAEFGGY